LTNYKSLLYCLLIIFLSTSFNYSCNKEEDDLPSQIVRLKEILHYHNGTETKKYTLWYQGLYIDRIEGYIPSRSDVSNWSQTENLSIYYVDNRIESAQSDFYDNEWYQQKVKVDIFTSQDLVYRTLYYNYNPDLDDWEEDKKAEFHGDGIHLSAVNYFDWEGTGWFQNTKTEYKYSSGTLSTSSEYRWASNEWMLMKNCSMQYNDGYLIEIIESRPDLGLEYRFVFEYDENRLTSIKKYIDYEGDWMGLETETFEYDQTGNLIKYESTHHQHQIINRYEFTYQLGGHNLEHYLQSENIFNYPYPLPYPVLLIK